MLLKQLLTVCFTILGGVAVLVFGEIAVKFFIEPLHKYEKLLGEIAHSLVFYANIYSNTAAFPHDDERLTEAKRKLRQHASDLRASAWTLRGYPLWRILGFVPAKQNIMNASTNLINLSHADSDTHTREHVKSIKQLLSLK